MSKSADQDLFERAMAGVTPLEEKDRGQPPRRTRRAGARTGGKTSTGVASRRDFQVELIGERVEGLRRDVDPRTLTRLKGLEYPPADRIDLHRLTRREARQAVENLLARASEAGTRCVLVIHGRGRGSSAGPVLKESVIEWLSRPPWSKRVLAFASAPPGLGGSGATLVLLRRRC